MLGVATYTLRLRKGQAYDHANRLISVVGPSTTSSDAYNGLGDRLQQTVDSVTESYTLDLNNWLTQVLADGTNTYLYGSGRLAQYDANGGEYFLGDALDSVRQLSDATGTIILVHSYQPFGNLSNVAGTANISYGFTGEWTDLNGLVYLRSRYYNPIIGRFLTKDSWYGDYYKPLTMNWWNYVGSNPINFVDPSGMFFCVPGCCEEWVVSALVRLTVHGGPFSQFVVNNFNFMDKDSPTFIFFVTDSEEGFGAAPVPGVIILPNYIQFNSRPKTHQIALFAHEIVHQTQPGFERYSVWGEAQAYIYSGKVTEEMGGDPHPHEKQIISRAYDINSPGFTTQDLPKLCEVKNIITSFLRNNSYYQKLPLLWIEYPIWDNICEK